MMTSVRIIIEQRSITFLQRDYTVVVSESDKKEKDKGKQGQAAGSSVVAVVVINII